MPLAKKKIIIYFPDDFTTEDIEEWAELIDAAVIISGHGGIAVEIGDL